MPTYRKVPARILTVDYVGVTTEESTRYRKAADLELHKLEQRVLRGKLDQGFSTTTIEPNVVCECVVMFQLKQAVVYIGRDKTERLIEKECYCCSPGLVAGVIMDLEADFVNDEPEYTEDADYYADVMICQAGSNELPKSITLEEETSYGGQKGRSQRMLQASGHGGEYMVKVPYAYRHQHQIGDSVWVLVMPLYNFINYPGEYMDCINNRQIATSMIENPWPTISPAYINSTGISCQITMDKQLWDPEIEPYTGDLKYYPFRILPIKIDSCLT